MIQQWFCEGCNTASQTEIPKGADVYTGLNALAASHADASPICHELRGIGRMRVRAPGCSKQEWSKVLRRDTPDKCESCELAPATRETDDMVKLCEKCYQYTRAGGG